METTGIAPSPRLAPVEGSPTDTPAAKHLARTILEHADAFDWTLQGLGMLRAYIGPEIRLHIWDSRYRIEGVSEMHTHPWDFDSLVIAGTIEQVRFVPVTQAATEWPQGAFMCQRLQCGAGGGLVGEPEQVQLATAPMERFIAGDWYTQAAFEIHRSRPLPGTVTLIQRHFRPDRDHANVYWIPGTEWVSAEPRTPTATEIADIVTHSLETWF